MPEEEKLGQRAARKEQREKRAPRRGVVDHGDPDNPNKKFATTLKDFGVPDPSNIQENGTLPEESEGAISTSVSETDLDTLNLGEKSRVFVQIAAMTSMNGKLVQQFCNKFLFGDTRISVPQCEKLMEKYSNDILRATNAVQVFMQQKFDALSFIAEAEAIQDGMMFVGKAQKRCLLHMEKWESIYDEELDKDAEDDKRKSAKLAYEQNQISRLTATMSKLALQYNQWATRRDQWVLSMDNLAIDAVKSTTVKGSDGEVPFLDARKLSNHMKQEGIDSVVADRVAAVVVHGDGHSQNGVHE